METKYINGKYYKVEKCKQCGKTFLNKNGRKQYCNRECYLSFYLQQPKIKEKARIRANEYHKKNRELVKKRARENYISKKKIYLKKCEWCKKEFKTEYIWQLCCSKKCSYQKIIYKGKIRYKKYKEKFKEDRKINEAKRLYNIDYDTYIKLTKKCAVCGYDRLVDLHHIDFDKTNSKIKNLIGLCPNCHLSIHRLGYILKRKNKKWVLEKQKL